MAQAAVAASPRWGGGGTPHAPGFLALRTLCRGAPRKLSQWRCLQWPMRTPTGTRFAHRHALTDLAIPGPGAIVPSKAAARLACEGEESSGTMPERRRKKQREAAKEKNGATKAASFKQPGHPLHADSRPLVLLCQVQILLLQLHYYSLRAIKLTLQRLSRTCTCTCMPPDVSPKIRGKRSC